MGDQKIKPKLGDKRPIESCPVCGGAQYEEYRYWPVYHNDVEYGWERREHVTNFRPGYSSCIKELLYRIQGLEKRLSEKGL